MRIIHTSDWHLGQYFYTKSRAAEHQAFFQWLIEQVKTYQVDGLIVAGDIFDTGSPPSYARELYNRFVVDLQATGCQLIMLAGNHDSVATLNESKSLLSYLNTQVITSAHSAPEDQVIILNSHQQKPAAIVCAIPFLRPRDIMTSHAGESAQQKQQQLQHAITEHYQASYQHALTLREQLNVAIPIIATGHLTTVGVSTSESEREIYIGTLDAYPAHAFPPADYIALGHIHRAQKVAKTEHIRYSGSPIALSFDELSSPKSVYLVEFEQQNLTSVTPLNVPVSQPMQLIKGSIADIEQQLRAFADSEQQQTVWLDIEVTSQSYLGDLQKQIEVLTADLPVEVVLLRRSKEQRQQMLQQQEKETLAELTVHDVFQRKLEQELAESEQEHAQQARLTTIFQQIVDEVVSGNAETDDEPLQGGNRS